MIYDIFFVLWFFLPAGLANTTPVFVAKLPGLRNLSYPLDQRMTWRGKRVLGDHKTWRGLVSGLVVGITVALLQQQIYLNSSTIRHLVPLDYAAVNPWALGSLLALGALGGDAFKSFLKRQKGIASGLAWFPFDQLDYIMGGIATTILWIPLSVYHYALLVLIWFLLHIISTHIGFWLRLKSSPL